MMASQVEPFDPTPCKRSMYQFLNALQDLNALLCTGLVAGSKAFKAAPFHIRQKTHMLQHLVEEGFGMAVNGDGKMVVRRVPFPHFRRLVIA